MRDERRRRKKKGPEKVKMPRVKFDLKAISEIKKRKKILNKTEKRKEGELNGCS